jgi:hypothetical protein
VAAKRRSLSDLLVKAFFSGHAQPDLPAVPDPAAWIVVFEPAPFRWIECLGGVWWYQAPCPPTTHACIAQTRGWLDHYYERCACGGFRAATAASLARGDWSDRNTRTP